MDKAERLALRRPAGHDARIAVEGEGVLSEPVRGKEQSAIVVQSRVYAAGALETVEPEASVRDLVVTLACFAVAH